MHIDERLAAIEFVEHRLDMQRRPATCRRSSICRPTPSAFSVSNAYSISLQRRVDVEHRQRCEQAEAARKVAHHLGAVVVAGARRCVRRPCRPASNHTPGVDGSDSMRRPDAVLIHRLDALSRASNSRAPGSAAACARLPTSIQRFQIFRRIEVVMRVDQRARRRLRPAAIRERRSAATAAAEPARKLRRDATAAAAATCIVNMFSSLMPRFLQRLVVFAIRGVRAPATQAAECRLNGRPARAKYLSRNLMGCPASRAERQLPTH